MFHLCHSCWNTYKRTNNWNETTYEYCKTTICTKPLIRFINATVIMSDSTLIDWVGKLELQGNKDKIIEMLKYMDPSISDICTISMDGRVQLYIRSGKNLIPLKLAGDGVNKLLYIILAIIESPNSVILIDEVETAIHKKYYDDIFSFIIKACQAFDVQLFITTHSLEAIDGLLSTQKYDEQNDYDSINVITLKRNDGNTYARVLSGREVANNRGEFGFEVRL